MIGKMENIKWTGPTNVGRWEIIGPYITTPTGERKWLCRCECGTERYVLERSLKGGSSKSCGCLTKENARKAIEHELSGKTFGDLKVLEKSANNHKYGKTWWVCECSCKTIVEIPGTLLVTGRKTHCGCKTVKNYYFKDITNQQFNKLTAKYPLPDRGHKGGVLWHCECECGAEVDVPYNWLVYSHIQSCGCQKKKHSAELPQTLTRVDGTFLDLIKSKKVPSNNKSGTKGVFRNRGKWVAQIAFQKKRYELGSYSDINDAIQARKAAEALLFDGTVAHYEQWAQKAKIDPKWAEQNPFRVVVAKDAQTRQLIVEFLPQLDQ